jgi:hypothetical protein
MSLFFKELYFFLIKCLGIMVVKPDSEDYRGNEKSDFYQKKLLVLI